MFVLTQAINGLTASAIVLVAALGMFVIFGNMKIVNLAHGEFIMIGAYICYEFTEVMELPFFVGILVALLITSLLGAIIELIVIKRFYGRLEETLLATYAISVILTQGIKLLFGAMSHQISLPISGSITVGTITVPWYNIILIILSVMMVIVVALVMYKTNLGIQLRAISQNRSMAQNIGINTKAIDTLSFAIGAGLAGFAGAVIAPARVVSPTMGSSYMLDSFFSVVIGGVDSLMGTIISSFGMGEANSVISAFTGEVTAELLVLIIIIIFIRLRPQGIFSKERR